MDGLVDEVLGVGNDGHELGGILFGSPLEDDAVLGSRQVGILSGDEYTHELQTQPIFVLFRSYPAE